MALLSGNQPQGTGLGHRAVEGLDLPRLLQQSRTLRRGQFIERQAREHVFTAGQHSDQQRIALMPSLHPWRAQHSAHCAQGNLALTAQGQAQGLVALDVQVVRGQAPGLGEGHLSRAGIATQYLGDPQAAVGTCVTRQPSGFIQGGDRTLEAPLTHLHTAQPQQRFRAVGSAVQRLLVRALGARQIARIQAGLAQFQPRLDARARQLGGFFIKRAGADWVPPAGKVVPKAHIARVSRVCAGRSGAGTEQQVAEQHTSEGQQGNATGHKQVSSSGPGKGYQPESMPVPMLQPGVQARRLRIKTLKGLSRACCLAWVLALAAPAGATVAAQPGWFSEAYPYVLVEQDLRKALDMFAQQLHLTLVLSDKVRGKSSSVVRGEQAGDFLRNLCQANGLSWYFDGNVLYLDRDDEVSSRLFTPRDVPVAQLRQYLAQLPVYGERLNVRDSPSGGDVLVSGPPAYLALVQQYVERAHRPSPPPSLAPSHGVRVFRGNSVSEELPR